MHRTLADAGLAPELIDCNRESSGPCMVVMEYLESRTLEEYRKDLTHSTPLTEEQESKLRCVMEQIKSIGRYLGEKKFVHGDIREPNLLVCESNGSEPQVNLIDFDWAGTEEEGVCYPLNVNPEAFYCHVVAPLWLILAEHDVEQITSAIMDTYSMLGLKSM